MKAIAWPDEFQFSCEKIAYWFFRLNGCLNLTNFLIHHERRGREGTEVDVLGVRFPYRSEFALSGRPMEDHQVFMNREQKLDIVIADSKKGLCDINRSWLLSRFKNMERILLVLGVFPEEAIETISSELYKNQCYEDQYYRINFYTFGAAKNTDLHPAIIQLEWKEVLLFIHNRFNTFEDYKRQHDQWDTEGKRLFKMANQYRPEPNQFILDVTANLSK
jgi:hypothetical protein